MPVERILPTADATDLIELTREIAARELAPRVDEAERTGAPPREVFRTLGRAGLLSLAYPEEFGGGGQPYEVYLQVVEELAIAWMSVAIGVSVHSLTAYPIGHYGTDEQRAALLPAILGGETLGGYCLSEREAGSDIAAMRTRATLDDDGSATLSGTKSWISHAAHADYYTTFARTDDPPQPGATPTRGKGISCFVVPADSAPPDDATRMMPPVRLGMK